MMDDQAGRRVAKELGLPVVGSAGLLLLAKQKGLIAAYSLTGDITAQGYWLSDAVLDESETFGRRVNNTRVRI